MTKAVIDLLNAAFAVEPKTIVNLMNHTVPCSEELAETHLVSVVPDEQLGVGWQISVLGMINAVLGALKFPPVAMKVTEITPDVEYERVLGFCEYTPPQPVASVAKVTHPMPIQQPPTYHWRPCPDITPYELAMCMPMLVAGAARLFDAVDRAYKLLPPNVQRHWDLVYTEQAPAVGELRTFGQYLYCFGMPEAAGDYLWFHPTDGPEKEQLLQNYNGDKHTWGRNTWYRCVKLAEQATEPTVTLSPPVAAPVARQFNIGCFEAEDMFGNKVWGAVGSDNDEVVLGSLRDASGAYAGFSDAYSCLKEWCQERGIRLKQTTLCVTHDFEKTAGVAIVT